MEITIFRGKLHYKWPSSIAVLNHQKVTNKNGESTNWPTKKVAFKAAHPDGTDQAGHEIRSPALSLWKSGKSLLSHLIFPKGKYGHVKFPCVFYKNTKWSHQPWWMDCHLIISSCRAFPPPAIPMALAALISGLGSKWALVLCDPHPTQTIHMAGWENPYNKWRFLARKITDFYDPFSSTPCLITGSLECHWLPILKRICRIWGSDGATVPSKTI